MSKFHFHVLSSYHRSFTFHCQFSILRFSILFYPSSSFRLGLCTTLFYSRVDRRISKQREKNIGRTANTLSFSFNFPSFHRSFLPCHYCMLIFSLGKSLFVVKVVSIIQGQGGERKGILKRQKVEGSASRKEKECTFREAWFGWKKCHWESTKKRKKKSIPSILSSEKQKKGSKFHRESTGVRERNSLGKSYILTRGLCALTGKKEREKSV